MTSARMPPLFGDTDKLNGANWTIWKENIKIIADIKRISEYLDGSIVNPAIPQQTTAVPLSIPSSTTTTLLPQPETTWDSPTPSPAKWKTYNAWTRMLILFNTKGATGLGINTTGIV